MQIEADVNCDSTRTTTCPSDELDSVLNKWRKQGFELASWCWRSRNLYVLRFHRTATTDAHSGPLVPSPEQTHPDIPGESATRHGGDGDVSALVGINE